MSEAVPIRSRVAVLINGLMMSWSLYWYTAPGDRALMIFSLMIVALALAAPARALRSTRSFVWTAVTLLILLFSANIERIAPPDDRFDLMVSYQYHRMVTVAFVPALTSLFMLPGRASGTMAVAGCLPMLIFIMAGQSPTSGEAHPSPVFMVGTTLGLILLVGQAHYCLRPRDPRSTPLHSGEIIGRLAFMIATLGLTALLAIPAEPLVTDGLRWLYRQRVFRPATDAAQGSFYLQLAAPPGGFEHRMRPVLSIRSPVPPGYLRQTVYRDLIHGKWAQRPIEKDNLSVPTMDKLAFTLNGALINTSAAPWRVRVLTRRWRSGSNLPQHTSALVLPQAQSIRINPDDNILWQNDVAPPTFQLWLSESDVAKAMLDMATPIGPARPSNYARVAGTDDIAVTDDRYRFVHKDWSTNVAEWASACEGLMTAERPSDKMAAVVRHFHDSFTYNIRGPPLRGRDALRAFMEERQGHCTLFATVATLMLRHAGVPARMVGGYLASERHPVTGDWIVRERDAHAWCEAWDAEAGGWRRVEATPANGLPLDFPPPGFLRAWFEAGLIGWGNTLDAIRNANPLVWLANAGAIAYVAIETWSTTPAGISILLAGIIALLLYVAWRKRARAPVHESDRLRAELIQAMERFERRIAGVTGHRNRGETWTEWKERTKPSHEVQERLDAYLDLRYRDYIDPAAARAIIKRLL